MSLYVKDNNTWLNALGNTNIAIGGLWTDVTSSREYDVVYTNNTGKLILVRAVPGIDRVNNPVGQLSTGAIAGTYSIAYVNNVPICRYRDNGTAEADFVKVETQFFVPDGATYKVEMYKYNNTNWNTLGGGNYVETFGWYEFEFQ